MLALEQEIMEDQAAVHLVIIIQAAMVMQVVLVHQKEVMVVMVDLVTLQVAAEVVQVQLDLMLVEIMVVMVVTALLHL